jgi:hypothetical protein
MMIDADIALFYHRLSENIFGPIDTGPNIGRTIFFQGGIIRNAETGELFDGIPIPGEIVGYMGNCPIIEITDGYVALPVTANYRLLNSFAVSPRSIH